MMSLQEMSDRLEIEQNVWDYSNAVDMHDWDLFRRIFVPEAKDLYGVKGQTLDEAIAWLQKVMINPPIIGYQHMFGGVFVSIAGDQAESLSHCFNPQNYTNGTDAALHLQFFFYHWHHVRTPDGWRIAGRGNQDTLPGRAPSGSRWAAPPVPVADRRLFAELPASQTPRFTT
jgi:hypothetical protein